jgi:hypothetical protein
MRTKQQVELVLRDRKGKPKVNIVIINCGGKTAYGAAICSKTDKYSASDGWMIAFTRASCVYNGHYSNDRYVIREEAILEIHDLRPQDYLKWVTLSRLGKGSYESKADLLDASFCEVLAALGTNGKTLY